MSKNLVVCCDGTWNTPDQKDNGLPCPTNVVKIFNLCIENSAQTRYYHPGVGADGNLINCHIPHDYMDAGEISAHG